LLSIQRNGHSERPVFAARNRQLVKTEIEIPRCAVVVIDGRMGAETVLVISQSLTSLIWIAGSR